MDKLKKISEKIQKQEERMAEIIKEKNAIVEGLGAYKANAVKQINRLTEEQIDLNNDVAAQRRKFNILAQPRQKVTSAKRNFLTSEMKDAIIKKRGNKCQECPCTDTLTVHHIKTLSHGGTNDDSNLEVLCVECHQKRHRV